MRIAGREIHLPGGRRRAALSEFCAEHGGGFRWAAYAVDEVPDDLLALARLIGLGTSAIDVRFTNHAWLGWRGAPAGLVRVNEPGDRRHRSYWYAYVVDDRLAGLPPARAESRGLTSAGAEFADRWRVRGGAAAEAAFGPAARAAMLWDAGPVRSVLLGRGLAAGRCADVDGDGLAVALGFLAGVADRVDPASVGEVWEPPALDELDALFDEQGEG